LASFTSPDAEITLFPYKCCFQFLRTAHS
jgi:hypothetical protein